MRKVGILGGTFNPPHIGHLIMANEVLESLRLDEVRFMPNAIPPHKTFPGVTNRQRLQMVELLIEGHEQFTIEPYELQVGGVSYTYETMRHLTKERACQFFFIVGGDSIDQLHTWYHIEELVRLVQFVGVARPGSTAQSAYPVMMVDAPHIDLSSSLLRQRLAQGKSVRYLIPEQVETFIREEGLYGATKLT